MVTPDDSSLEITKPTGHRKRFRSISLSSLLMLVTLLSFVFANEANHHYHQRKVIENLSADDWDSEVRYRWMASRHFVWLDHVFGSNWNLDVVSVRFEWDSDKARLLLEHASKLKRLRIVNVRYGSWTESDIRILKQFRSLQWLALVECDVDADSMNELRRDLPNTYVSFVPPTQ